MLTIGMQQHYELGQMYLDYFVNTTSLLPPKFSPDLIFPRSTMVDRAIRSCISFFQGMYPPSSPNEVVHIMTDTDSASFLDPETEFCDELVDQVSYFVNTSVFQTFFSSFSSKYQIELEPIIGSWDPSAVKKFVSWVVTVNCTDHPLPGYVTDAMIADCTAFLAIWMYGMNDNDRFRGVGSSPVLREMFRMADDFLAMKSSYRFVFLSSHDTQIGALLPVFGQIENIPPVFRSHFLFELWDVNNVIMARLSYNGRVLPVSFLGNETVVRYSSMKAEMARRGYFGHCPMPPWKARRPFRGN
jgi:acid phosphatase